MSNPFKLEVETMPVKMQYKVSREERETLCRALDYQTYFDKFIVPNKEGYYPYGVDFVASNRRCNCPLHPEDTPSFSLYDKNGVGYFRWHCFGCSKDGDILDLHYNFSRDELNRKITLRQAYDELKKAFLDGGASITLGGAATRIKLASDENKEISSVEDLQEYYDTRNKIESYFMSELGDCVPVSIKTEIYNLLDKFDIIIDNNLENAKEVSDKLIKTVRSNGIEL